MAMFNNLNLDPKMENLLNFYQKVRGVETVVKEKVWEKTVEVSLEEEQEIKDAMPVDTGRAKASWGHFTPTDLVAGSRRLTRGKKITKKTKYQTGEGLNSGDIQIANAADAIWEENKAALTLTQGTLVPYTEYLNRGHSMRAPSEFITNAHEVANYRMHELADTIGTMFANLFYGK